jgi:hypothetical protein
MSKRKKGPARKVKKSAQRRGPKAPRTVPVNPPPVGTGGASA